MSTIRKAATDQAGINHGNGPVTMATAELGALQRTWESKSEGYFTVVEKLTHDLVGRGYRVEGMAAWCREWLTATNALDVDGSAALVAPDVVWEDPILFGGSVQGRDEFRSYLGLFWGAVKDLQLYPAGPPMVYIDETAMHFCQPWHAIGSWTAPLATWPVRPGGPTLGPTGRMLDFEGVDRYTFPVDADGGVDWHITLGQTVYCTANVLHQVGLFPHPGSRVMAPVRAAMRAAAFGMRHLPARRSSNP